MEIYVTGLGLVTALGLGTDINHNKLKSGLSGIGISKIGALDSKALPVGEFEWTNKEISDHLSIAYSPLISRTALLGLLAARQIDQGISSNLRKGFINGSTVGGMDRSEIYYRQKLMDKDDSNFRHITMHDLGAVTNFISESIGPFHYTNTISTACSSSANSIMLGARMIQAGILDSVVAGGCDALSAFTIEGFNSLMIYDAEPLKPFDKNRKGLNLGEGAGYIQLESEKSIKVSGNTPLAKLSGWHNANDSYHQTAISPEGIGPQLAIKGALKKAGLNPNQIDYINAHGTGTANNDQSELTAIESVFETVPLFSSTKSALGHTLGAAGGIEAVLSVLSILNSVIYPGINWKTPMDGFKSRPVTSCITQNKIAHVLSNSFGFGGNSSSLIFSEI
jgi:3-oxoacyl-[acyl-carrier-protein] synthase-1